MTECRQIALLFSVSMAIGAGGAVLAYLSGPFTPLDSAAVLFVLGTPFLFLLLYVVHGREKDETVPAYLSEVPNPSRKPWLVNLVFGNDVFESTDGAFYATVLDLQRRGYVALSPEDTDGWVRIRILRDTSEDPYEQDVLRFLGFITDARLPNPEEVGRIIFSTLASGTALFELGTKAFIQLLRGGGSSHMFSMGGLIHPPEGAVNAFFEDGRRRVIPVFLAAVALYLLATVLTLLQSVWGILLDPSGFYRIQYGPSGFSTIQYGPSGLFIALFAFFLFFELLKGQKKRGGMARAKYLVFLLILGFLFAVIVLPGTMFGVISPAQMLMFVVGFQCLASTRFPPTLLGKWKADAYREKLQWDAFRSFLSDMVKIRGYSDADRAMWGEWLIYGTALGVGEGVTSAMGDLHIQLPEQEMGEAIKAAVQRYAESAAKEARLREAEGT